MGPVASLYLPASHAMHVPPLGPVYPALHAQSSLASLAAFSCTHGQMVLPHVRVLHSQPGSNEQVLLHPSPVTVLPSSQSSDACFPSPQLDKHTLGWALPQSNPHSTEQVDEHPSPFWALPSSQVSVPATLPSLHTEAQAPPPRYFGFGVKYRNLKTWGVMSTSPELLRDGIITMLVPLYSTVIDPGSRGGGESVATAMVPSVEPECIQAVCHSNFKDCRYVIIISKSVALYCNVLVSVCTYRAAAPSLTR